MNNHECLIIICHILMGYNSIITIPPKTMTMNPTKNPFSPLKDNWSKVEATFPSQRSISIWLIHPNPKKLASPNHTDSVAPNYHTNLWCVYVVLPSSKRRSFYTWGPIKKTISDLKLPRTSCPTARPSLGCNQNLVL